MKLKKILSTLIVGVLLLPIFPTKIEAMDNGVTFEMIDDFIEAETRYGLSGAQLAVIHKGEFVHSKGYGYVNNFENVFKEDGSVDFNQYRVIPESERVPVTTSTLFDLASNTKMYATVYAIQKLVQDGELSLDTRVQSIFPDFVYPGHGVDQQDNVTIEDLLEHKAGFTPDPQYHNNFYSGNLGSEEGENHLFTQDREKTKEMVLKTPLVYERGAQHSYSDADFMLLGMIIEKVTGQDLDSYMKENFYKPLGLHRITFNPLQNGFTKDEIVASEVHGNTRGGNILFENARDTVVWGEVHDEKAHYSMDGISGHAGLFGNAEEIAKLAYEMIKEDGIFTQETKEMFMKASPLNDTYAVGWRTQGPQKRYSWAFSEYASENTIGHTGWTGTLTVIDPDNDLVIALFTNSRNTPIMGPGLNDFFTKNLNTNSYGPISTLVYEALGLGSNRTADEILIQMFENELPESIDEVSISKRNAIRALMSTIEHRSLSSEKLRSYMQEDLFKSMLRHLEKYDDFEHLGSPKTYRLGHLHLEELVLQLESIDNIYTEETWGRFTQALSHSKKILADLEANQDLVDEAEKELLSAYEALEIFNDDEQVDDKTDQDDAEDEDKDKVGTNQNEAGEKDKVEKEQDIAREKDDQTSVVDEKKDMDKIDINRKEESLPSTGLAPVYLYSGTVLALVGLYIRNKYRS